VRNCEGLPGSPFRSREQIFANTCALRIVYVPRGSMRFSMYIAGCATAVTLFSQSGASGQAPAFDVASVKPAALETKTGAGLFTYPGGRIVASRCALDYLIQQAFDVQPFQVTGGPGWIHNDRFDIEAKPPASSKSAKSNPSNFKLPPNDEQRQMMQMLLADRFHLKFHRESRQGTVYILAKGSKPLRLQEPKNKDEYPWAGIGPGLVGTNISMTQFAKRLATESGYPVLDQTGLTGSFDFRFENHTDDPHPDPIFALITSLQGLGLKLESSKGLVEIIAIDSVEKPSGN
jgi:uncharacterized protein (TIGR03435 family)